MSNTKHTPTPWETCDAFGLVKDGQCVKAAADNNMICSMTGYYGRDGAIANAAFIVRACNSHEQLVAALRKIAEISKAAEDSDIEAWAQELYECGKVSRAALAAAEV